MGKKRNNNWIRTIIEYVFFSACYRIERWSYEGGYSRGAFFLFVSIACYIHWGLHLIGYDMPPIAVAIFISSMGILGGVFAEIKEEWYKELKKKYLFDEETTDYGYLVLLFIIIPYIAFFIIT